MRLNVMMIPAVVLALSAGRGLTAQQAAMAEPGTIRVSATGDAKMTPDQAWIDFGMEVIAPTAREAGERNAAAMTRVIAALTRAGVTRADIQTSGYNLYPDYVPTPNGDAPPVLRGYRATNTVTVRTDAIARVGALIDAALAAGANRADGIRFGLRNPAAARAIALREAIERGRAEAQVIAEGLGVRLGRLLDASTVSAPRVYPMMRMAARAEAMDAASTPVEPGQTTESATISLVFAVEGGR